MIVASNGTPLIQRKTVDGFKITTSYRTLNGKKYDKEVRSPEPCCTLSNRSSWPLQGRVIWLLRVTQIGTISGDVAWYFVHDGLPHAHGYFVGYDRKTRLKLGYIGRDGFRPDEPPTSDQFSLDGRLAGHRGVFVDPSIRNDSWQTFPSNSQTSNNFFLLVVDNGLVAINLDDRTSKVVLKDANFVSAASWHGKVAVRMPDRVLILQPDGKEIRSFPLPVALRDSGNFQLCELPKSQVLLYREGQWDTDIAFWIDVTGKVLRHESVSRHYTGGDRWPSPTEEAFVISTVVMPSPGAIAALVGFKTWQGRPLEHNWPYFWPGLLGATIISMVLAVCSYRRQRKYGLPWTWVWTGFVLLFGVPAYLGYLAHRSWPVRLACPSCGKLAPRDREACFACGREFPAPAAKGIEVFA